MIITWDTTKCLKLLSVFDKEKAQYRKLETDEKYSPLSAVMANICCFCTLYK